MDKDFNLCPICKETLNDRKARRLPCNMDHVFCKDCLINLEKYLQLKSGDKFPCPICKTYSKWPKGGVNYFTEVIVQSIWDEEEEMDDNDNDKNDNIEDIYISRKMNNDNFSIEFKKILLKEIENSEELKKNELNKLDNKINILKATIHKKQAILKDEIEIFYSQRQSKLKELIRECEYLQQIPHLSGGRTSCLFKEKYDSIKQDLNDLKEKIVRNEAILVTENDDIQIGTVIFSQSDPNEREILVDGYISKVKSFNNGIFAFSTTKDRISWTNVETGENMTWSFKPNSGFLDQEICLNEDNLIYIFHGINFETSRIFTVDSHFKDARKEKKIKAYVKLTDPRYITFSNVLFFKMDSYFIMYDKNQKLLANMDLKKQIIDLKIINNKVFFLLSNGKIKKLENGNLTDLKLIKYDEKFTILDNILPKLKSDNNDKFLLIDDNFLYLINENSKKVLLFNQKNLFTNNERIKGYKIGLNKILFAIIGNKDKDKIILKYFDF